MNLIIEIIRVVISIVGIKKVRKWLDAAWKKFGWKIIFSVITIIVIIAIIVIWILVNNVKFEMVHVQGGTFWMGCYEEDNDCRNDEKPLHIVKVSNFYIGKYEVTQEQWKAIMGEKNNPSHFIKGDSLPVESVSYKDVQKFITRLNKVTGKEYRLPTEAEWEYAARGGNKSKGYKYSGSIYINDVGWFAGNSDGTTHPVGKMKPNELKIYDMSGNVCEWCSDWYSAYSEEQHDPRIALSDSCRVFRGGSWHISEEAKRRDERPEDRCRVAFRNYSKPNQIFSSLGFRLVLQNNDNTKRHSAEPEMIQVTGGTFIMGCTPIRSIDCENDESPFPLVTLSDFKIGKYEVTQKQWKAIMGDNPSKCKGKDLPVESVSWNEVNEFICLLNEKTGKNYRLPTEAEWEYAARGGAKSQGYKYSGNNNLNDVGWVENNSGGKTHPVNSKSPNELGIYNMSGNVWEWCSNWYSVYLADKQRDPAGTSSKQFRVFRGGGWGSEEKDCRVANRDYNYPEKKGTALGFRLVLP